MTTNKMQIKTIIFSLLLLPIFAAAQILEPVTWTSKVENLGNQEYLLTFEAEIDDTWNVYSQHTSDDGPVPTLITYDDESVFKKVGPSEEIGHKKEGFDKLFDTNVIKFLGDENFIIKQKIKAKPGTSQITGYLTYMTCDATKCLPPADYDFTFNLGGTASANKGIGAITGLVNESQPIKIKGIDNTNQSNQNTAADQITLNQQSNQAQATNEKASSDVDAGKIKNPIKWDINVNELGNNEYEISYKAAIQKGWNVYSQDSDEEGPVPTTITYEENNGVTLTGNAVESGHKKSGRDPLFGNVMVIKYLSDQPFEIKQKVKANNDANIKGYLTYMACNEEGCLPPVDVDFSFDFDNLNKASSATTAATSGTAGTIAAVAPSINGDQIDQKIPTIKSSLKKPLSDCGGAAGDENKSLFYTFIFGFFGGLIALLTPCVFPMIPLTVSFFTKDTKRKGWVNGLIYATSIIVIYVAMGVLLTLVFGPKVLNELSTNWIANTLFFVIFIFFAFSFFGFYEITLPSSWTTKSDKAADKGGFLGIFFMAFTLALVSFSCTGPIIGTALVQAASSAVGPAIVMFGFSLGLALPFGLFAAFPAWLNSLPQSGGWMNSVKVVLGFLELALAFKFLSVADMTSHWGFLRYELFMGIWVLVFIGMTLYLFGFIKFPHDSPVKKLSPMRWVFALSSLAFTLYLATGFMYNDSTKSYNALGAMSGLAPPANYNFFLEKKDAHIDQSIRSRFPSFTKCANDIDCFKDYYEGMTYAKEVNKPVFLDFTGHGCVNCRKTEEHIWIKDNIRKKLNEDFVLVSLYVDDREKLEKTYITEQDGEMVKLRNVGNKWADFQITNFGQNSQPLYIMMTPDEQVIARPRGYQEGAKDYHDFMECGLNAFNKESNSN